MERSISVLLVDDDNDFRSIMKFWLNSKGYAVLEAANGEMALPLVRENNPDVIFLDCHMPGMSGVETLREIRKINKDVPVMIISAHLSDTKMEWIPMDEISGIFYKDEHFEKVLPLLASALRTHKKLKK